MRLCEVQLGLSNHIYLIFSFLPCVLVSVKKLFPSQLSVSSCPAKRLSSSHRFLQPVDDQKAMVYVSQPTLMHLPSKGTG